MNKKSLKKALFNVILKRRPELYLNRRKTFYPFLGISHAGLSEKKIENRRRQYSENEIAREWRDKRSVTFIKTFINPVIGILIAFAFLSPLMNMLSAKPPDYI